MNYQLKLRSIALSTLLLSSLASPVFADAARTSDSTEGQAHPTAVQLTAATAQPVQGSLVDVRVPDVLSLVRSYAPETVQDWTDILSRYGKAARIQTGDPDILGHASTITLTDGDAAPVLHITAPGSLTAALSSAAASAPLGSLQNVPVKLKGVIQTAGSDGILTISAVPAAAISAASLATITAADTISTVQFSGTATTAAAALLPLPEDTGLFKAQATLSAAVDSKDAAAIKQALAELLKAYKALVSNLEAAK